MYDKGLNVICWSFQELLLVKFTFISDRFVLFAFSNTHYTSPKNLINWNRSSMEKKTVVGINPPPVFSGNQGVTKGISKAFAKLAIKLRSTIDLVIIKTYSFPTSCRYDTSVLICSQSWQWYHLCSVSKDSGSTVPMMAKAPVFGLLPRNWRHWHCYNWPHEYNYNCNWPKNSGL